MLSSPAPRSKSGGTARCPTTHRPRTAPPDGTSPGIVTAVQPRPASPLPTPPIRRRVALVCPDEVPPAAVRQARALFPQGSTVRDRDAGPWQAVYVEGEASVAPDVRPVADRHDLSVAVVSGPLLEGPELVVMDVDSTFITSEVIEEIAEAAGTRTEVARVTEQAMRGEIDFAESLARRVATLVGVHADFLREVTARVQYTPGAEELVRAVQGHGGHVGLVSGGFIEVVAPLAERLGIHLVRANRLEVDDHGLLTGRTLGRVVDGAAKVEFLGRYADQVGADPARTVAMGDGANDLGMIAAAGLGVAFCAKPVVRQQAPGRITFRRLDALCGLLDI